MSEPELTPQQDEQVRRLLAEARHDAPIPADVAARLDDVLAGLTRDEAAPDTAPVVDLAARRRRRNASVLLAAAAAVIVGGFGIGRVIDVGGNDSDAGGAGTAADSAVEREPSVEAGSEDAAGGTSEESAAPETDAQLRDGEPLRLSSESLASDVEAQLPLAAAAPSAPGDDGAANIAPQEANPCATAAPPAYGDGEFFAAFYDGIPALLVLRPAQGDRQRADVLDCDTAEQLDSVELPVP